MSPLNNFYFCIQIEDVGVDDDDDVDDDNDGDDDTNDNDDHHN